MNNKNRSGYFAPALEKGLDVLEALAVARTPQTLAQLARTLNRTSSELFRMIDALEKRFYIIRDPETVRTGPHAFPRGSSPAGSPDAHA
jgi:DNA-binding IclR family transcriptional regulator